MSLPQLTAYLGTLLPILESRSTSCDSTSVYNASLLSRITRRDSATEALREITVNCPVGQSALLFLFLD